MTLYPKQERRTKTFRITNDSYSIDSFFFEREERQKSTWRYFSNEEDFNKNLLLGRQIGKTDLSLAFPRPKFGGWVLRSSKTLEASLEEPSKREKGSAIYGMQAPVHPPCCESIPVLVSRTTRPRLDSITTSVNSTLRFRNNWFSIFGIRWTSIVFYRSRKIIIWKNTFENFDK